MQLYRLLTGPDDAALRGILEGSASLVLPSPRRLVERGEGALAPRDDPVGPEDREGEPI